MQQNRLRFTEMALVVDECRRVFGEDQVSAVWVFEGGVEAGKRPTTRTHVAVPERPMLTRRKVLSENKRLRTMRAFENERHD